ncbi:MAG: hypothetical protein CVU80_01675, partial [Elusimicrobia bacterium HGW-Elusimicrobia-4]
MHGKTNLRKIFLTVSVALLFSVFNFQIVNAANGSGTCTVNPSAAIAGSTGKTFTFTYTASEVLQDGGIKITAPAGWAAPQGTPNQSGYTTFSVVPATAIANVIDNLDYSMNYASTSWQVNSPNLTVSSDTATKYEGVASLKVAQEGFPLSAFNADCYHNFGSAQNWSNYTKVSFWIRTALSVNLGGITFKVSESADLVSPSENIDLPALTANT